MVVGKRQWSRVIWGPYTEDLKEAVLQFACAVCIQAQLGFLCVIWRPLPRIIQIGILFVSWLGNLAPRRHFYSAVLDDSIHYDQRSGYCWKTKVYPPSACPAALIVSLGRRIGPVCCPDERRETLETENAQATRAPAP